MSDIDKEIADRIRARSANSGIYAIWNAGQDRYYIGQSFDPQQRMKQHESDLRHGRHHNQKLQEDFSANPDAFLFFVLERVGAELLDERELEWARLCRSFDPKYGYNIRKGGSCSAETIARKMKYRAWRRNCNAT